jgi:hypothetical protein
MYDVKQAANYSANVESTGALRDGYEPCMVCGKAVNTNKSHWRSLFHCGGATAVTEEEYGRLEITDPGAGMGSYPVGPTCLKENPELKAYVVRNPGGGN